MTTSEVRGRRSAPARAQPAPPEVAGSASPALRILLESGVTVRARRRQRLSLAIDQNEILYVVRSGVLLLSATLPGKRRELIAILYPGDIYRSSFAPAVPEVSLTAATAVEVTRMRWSAAEQLAASDPSVLRYLATASAGLHARLALHIATIGSLSGEERAASFLVDVALRLGVRSGDGSTFELPLTRADIADHLSLNADTLSRIMSRLKGAGLFHLAGRRRVVISDWTGLCALTPIADILQEQNAATTLAGAA